jgi:hypothetical protein
MHDTAHDDAVRYLRDRYCRFHGWRLLMLNIHRLVDWLEWAVSIGAVTLIVVMALVAALHPVVPMP